MGQDRVFYVNIVDMSLSADMNKITITMIANSVDCNVIYTKSTITSESTQHTPHGT
jgi:hypothetical protein